MRRPRLLTRHRRWRGAPRRALLTAAAAALLTGCYRTDATFTVAADGTVSGQVIVAARVDTIERLGGSRSDALAAMDRAFATPLPAGARLESYEGDGTIGRRLVLRDLPISSMDELSPVLPMRLDHLADGRWSFTATIDRTRSPLADPNAPMDAGSDPSGGSNRPGSTTPRSTPDDAGDAILDPPSSGAGPGSGSGGSGGSGGGTGTTTAPSEPDGGLFDPPATGDAAGAGSDDQAAAEPDRAVFGPPTKAPPTTASPTTTAPTVPTTTRPTTTTTEPDAPFLRGAFRNPRSVVKAADAGVQPIITIRLTFPTDVLTADALATVDGKTVSWSPPAGRASIVSAIAAASAPGVAGAEDASTRSTDRERHGLSSWTTTYLVLLGLAILFLLFAASRFRRSVENISASVGLAEEDEEDDDRDATPPDGIAAFPPPTGSPHPGRS